MLFVDGDGSVGDPSGGLDTCPRPPVSVHGEGAEPTLVLQMLSQGGGLGIDICHLACGFVIDANNVRFIRSSQNMIGGG